MLLDFEIAFRDLGTYDITIFHFICEQTEV